MRFSDLLGREAWVALDRTPARAAITWTVPLALLVLGFLNPLLLPWWGWTLIGLLSVGSACLMGCYWAAKDREREPWGLPRRLQR
jgi:hypothetical protein